MAVRRVLFVGAVLAAGCNALTGANDLHEQADASTSIPDATPPMDAPADVEVTETVDADAAVDAEASVDAGEDARADADASPPPPTPTSCAALARAHSSPPSGGYTIDPDGSGSGAPISVYCDFATAGGGWTEVFRWSGTNLTMGQADYIAGTAPVVAGATMVLMTYRNETTGGVTGNTAVFPIPDDWKKASPFKAAATDVDVNVSVDGATATTELLRYGGNDFNTLCTDDWLNDNDSYGRICIEDTSAPFFSAWNDTDGDLCAQSNQAFNAGTCSASLAFSIAVR